MSDLLVYEALSIFVVRSRCISEFLTVNDFILKLDVCQFIGELCLVRSYYNIAGRCKSEFKNKLIKKSSWEEDSMILHNLMIQWNPIFFLINIIELILPVNFWFLLISVASDIGKINRLNNCVAFWYPIDTAYRWLVMEIDFLCEF